MALSTHKLPGYRKNLTVYPVAQCPDNEATWNAAATTLGCNVDNSTPPFRHYYCLPIQSKSKLVQFCYDKNSYGIKKGACLELDKNGYLSNVDCKNFKNGCPDEPYLSETIYKFQACLEVNTEQRCYLAVNDCLPSTSEASHTQITQEFTTADVLSTLSSPNTSLLDNSIESKTHESILLKTLTSTQSSTSMAINTTVDDSATHILTIVIPVPLLILIIIIIIAFCIWKRKGQSTYTGVSNESCREEDQALLDLAVSEVIIAGETSAVFGTRVTYTSNVVPTSVTLPVKWQRGDGDSFIDIDKTKDKYIGSSEILHRPLLVINNIDFNDTAVYRLVVDHVVSNTIHLHVTGYIEIAGETTVIYGNSVTYTSTIKCNPVSSVKWQRKKRYNYVDINIMEPKYTGSSTDINSPVLVINSVDFNDQATYRLMIEDDYSNTIALRVTGSPPDVYLSGITQDENKVVIMCSASAKPDSPNIKKITWKKDGKEIIMNDDNRHKYRHGDLHSHSLEIYNLERSDAGSYSVVVENDVGNTESNAIELAPPDVYLSGITQDENKVVIMCSASVKPDSPNIKKITWKKDGKEIIMNDDNRHKYRHGDLHSHSLEIYNLERSDAGSYSVVVENDVGNTESNAIELAPPDVYLSGITQDENKVVIMCSASVKPDSPNIKKITWKKDGKEIIKNDDNRHKYRHGDLHSHSLEIYNLERSDAGSYSVVVENDVGNTESNAFELGIEHDESDDNGVHLPLIEGISIAPPDVYLSGITQDENKVVIMCTASVKPDSPNIKKITWKKDGKEIIKNDDNRHKYRHGDLHSHSLEIYNLERSDAGSYSVVVENDVGNTESNSFELDELFTRPIQIQAFLCLVLLQVYRAKSWRKTQEFFGCHMNEKFDNVSNVFADNEEELTEFIYKTNGHGYKYRSPREKNSVFLSFVKNITFLDFFIENASKERLMEFCRTTNYQPTDGEVCANLTDQQTEKFIDKVHLDILTHCTLKDTTMHKLISERLKIPKEILKWGRPEIENYYKQLTSGSVCVYHARGMIVGCGGAGKTTLLKKLKNLPLEEIIKTSSTRGIDIETDAFNVTGNNIEVAKRKVAAYININNTEDVTGHDREVTGVSNSDRVDVISQNEQKLTIDNSNNELERKPERNETLERKPDSDKKPETDQSFAHENTSDSKLYEENHKLETFSDETDEPEDEEKESNVKELHSLAGLCGFSKDILKSITFLDFAGQESYYACHHIYLSPRAFYVLVIDMSKSLDDRVSQVDDGSLYSGWTYKDFIVFWMKSIHTYSSSTAPVILIASHSEGKTKENVIDFFCDVCALLPKTIQEAHLDRKRMFAVELEADTSMNDIKKCIATLVQKLYHWGERRPTSWVIFEQYLRLLSTENKIIKTEDLWKQNKTLRENVQLDNINKMREMLSFFHDTGIIVFYNEEFLREIVILDVQWFVNSFKNVITDHRHAMEDLPSNITEWKEFNATGILQSELLLDIWGRDNETYKPFMNDIMMYMERLGMLAKTQDYPTETWYVPSANRRSFPRKQFHNYSVSSTLCFEFDFLPSIIYHRLIALCISQLRFDILTTGEQETKSLYRSALVFQTKSLKENYVLLGMCQNSIELQILSRCDTEIKKQESTNLKLTIEANLKFIMRTFHTNLGDFIIGYRCKNVLFNENPSTHIIHESAFIDPYIPCRKCDFQNKKTINVGEVLCYWNQTIKAKVELSRSLKLPGLSYGLHMSCLTSEKAWICDDDGHLALIDDNEKISQKVDDVDETYLYGYHCLNSDGELLYADWYNHYIKKVKTENNINSFIDTWDYEPRCIFCSKQNGDILVGLKEKLDNGIVIRYNRSGTFLQEIQKDQRNRILFKWPRYITENIQGDILVSEYGRAVVVVDRSGQFRFEYKCDPRGICTDRLGNILICDYPKCVIHRLDMDGNFLSYLITYGHETENPAGISFDEEHNLWIGHFMNETVHVYKYLHDI